MAKPPAKKPAPRKKPAARKKTKAVVTSATPQVSEKKGTFPIEVDPQRIEETLNKISGELRYWANKGRYTKVRFKFRGRQLLPDLPLAAVVAAQGLTFYWGGILRAILLNLAGNTVFDVELVNDSEKRIQRGKECLLSGDLDQALACFEQAIHMDRDNAHAHLNLGVAHKLKGSLPLARAALERARALDPEGPWGAEAQRLLASLSPSVSVLSP